MLTFKLLPDSRPITNIRVYAVLKINTFVGYELISWCAPENVRTGHIIEVVSNYIKAHPEHWRWKAKMIVATALPPVSG